MFFLRVNFSQLKISPISIRSLQIENGLHASNQDSDMNYYRVKSKLKLSRGQQFLVIFFVCIDFLQIFLKQIN